jgi:hypothetical protein
VPEAPLGLNTIGAERYGAKHPVRLNTLTYQGNQMERASHRQGVKANEKLVLLTFCSAPALDPPVSPHLIALIRCS